MVTIKETLRTVFGFHEFRAPQQEVIEQVLAGEDVFLVMPTGEVSRSVTRSRPCTARGWRSSYRP